MQKYQTQHKREIVLFQLEEFEMDLPDTFLDRQTIEKYLCSTGIEKHQRRLVFSSSGHLMYRIFIFGNNYPVIVVLLVYGW